MKKFTIIYFAIAVLLLLSLEGYHFKSYMECKIGAFALGSKILQPYDHQTYSCKVNLKGLRGYGGLYFFYHERYGQSVK